MWYLSFLGVAVVVLLILAYLAGDWLYLLTILYDLPGAAARLFITLTTTVPMVGAWSLFVIADRLTRGDTRPGEIFAEQLDLLIIFWVWPVVLWGIYPVIASVMTLLVPGLSVGRGVINQWGARLPVTATGETNALEIAKKEVNRRAKEKHLKFYLPEVYVIDNPYPNSYTVGRIVYLNTGLFETPYLAAALAHELGHMAVRDGRMLLALRRLVIPFVYFLGIDRQPKPAGIIQGQGAVRGVTLSDDAQLYYSMQTIQTKLRLAFWFGGSGLLWLGQRWAEYWRDCDFRADIFAAKLGYGQELAEFLSEYRQLDIAQPYLLRGRPYSAERLENLKRFQEAAQAKAERSQEQEDVQKVENLMSQVGEYMRKPHYTREEATDFESLLDMLEAMNESNLHQDTVQELVTKCRQLLEERGVDT